MYTEEPVVYFIGLDDAVGGLWRDVKGQINMDEQK
jgi:hypothetical protein